MDDLAQYSPLRRPTRAVDSEPPFRFQTPIVFTVVPPVPLERDRRAERDQPELRLRRFGPPA